MAIIAIQAIFICILIYSHAEEDAELLEQMQTSAEVCAKETNADRYLVERFVKYDEFPGNHDLKCFMKCYFLKMNIMSDYGEVDVYDLIKVFLVTVDKVKGADIIEKCAVLKGIDDCDTAYHVAKCIYES